MKSLETFLYPTQKKLFNMIQNIYGDKTIWMKDAFILVKGEAPAMLLAHLDTVHKESVRDICRTDDGNILMSPQGIGGDDRCGVYALVKVYETAVMKPWLLFTCNEETGGIGAKSFCSAHQKGKLPEELDDLKILVEIDRHGNKDAVYYDCGNEKFEEYITSKGFETAFGTFSDISFIAPELGVAAVNLSSGYYHEHTKHEYIDRRELDVVIKKVIEIVADSMKTDFPKYEYVKRTQDAVFSNLYYGSNSDFGEKGFVKLISKKYRCFYYDLLNYYDENTLKSYWDAWGDEIFKVLWENEFEPYFEYDC